MTHAPHQAGHEPDPYAPGGVPEAAPLQDPMDYSSLPVRSVLRWYRRSRDSAWRSASDEDPLAGTAWEGRAAELCESIGGYLDGLPVADGGEGYLADVSRSRRLYTDLARSETNTERQKVAVLINHITRIDHDFGLGIWEELVRDPESFVRQSAVYNVGVVASQAVPEASRSRVALQTRGNELALFRWCLNSPELDEEVLGQLSGLDGNEARALMLAYEAAEHDQRDREPATR